MNERDIDFTKAVVRFIRKPAKMGERYVFNIPKNFIENGLIDPGTSYIIYLAKSEENETEDD